LYQKVSFKQIKRDGLKQRCVILTYHSISFYAPLCCIQNCARLLSA